MTYEDLLDEICMYYSNGDMPGSDRLVSALRAIMELHKPVDIEFPDVTFCEDCGESGFYLWPCTTIQAIEKELG